MLDKEGIIKQYILAKDEDLRKKRIEVAWDIHDHFDELRRAIVIDFIYALSDKLKMEFPESAGWQLVSDEIKDMKKHSGIYIFKSSWQNDKLGKKLISLKIDSEWGNCNGLVLGICKENEDLNLNEEKCDQIYQRLASSGNGDKDEQWIYWQNALSKYRDTWAKEFILKFITQAGRDEIVNYYVNMLKMMEKEASGLIDEVVEEWKISND